MSLLNLTSLRRRRLLSAVRLHHAGRNRVVWRNGVLYCGGSLFLLYNALDYFIEPHARATPTQLTWFFVALAASLAIGYLYGRFTWHSLHSLFSEQELLGGQAKEAAQAQEAGRAGQAAQASPAPPAAHHPSHPVQ